MTGELERSARVTAGIEGQRGLGLSDEWGDYLRAAVCWDHQIQSAFLVPPEFQGL